MRRTRSKSLSMRFTEQFVDLVVDFAVVVVASHEDVQNPQKSGRPRPSADTSLPMVHPGWKWLPR